MIIEKNKKVLTDFEKKYFMEADDPPRTNVRQITLDDDGTRRINGEPVDHDDIDTDEPDEDADAMDDTAGDDIDAEPEDGDDDVADAEAHPEANVTDTGAPATDDTTADTTTDDTTTTDTPAEPVDTDTSDTGDVAPGSEPTGEDPTNTPDDTADPAGAGDTDVSTEPDDGDDAADDTGDAEGDDAGDDVDIEPDDNGGTDNGTADDTGGDTGDDVGGDDTSQTPEDVEEAIHKRALFGKYENLYDTLGKYISKLNQLVGRSDDTNHEFREIGRTFTHLQTFLYDYMIISFKEASYGESMLFYQRAIAVTNLTLDLLAKIKRKDDKLVEVH